MKLQHITTGTLLVLADNESELDVLLARAAGAGYGVSDRTVDEDDELFSFRLQYATTPREVRLALTVTP